MVLSTGKSFLGYACNKKNDWPSEGAEVFTGWRSAYLTSISARYPRFGSSFLQQNFDFVPNMNRVKTKVNLGCSKYTLILDKFEEGSYFQ